MACGPGGAFQAEHHVASEFEYMQKAMREGWLMQDAHLEYRSLETTVEAIREIYGTCVQKGVRVDRFGMCLDCSMGYKSADRAGAMRGTGLILEVPDDFRRVTEAAPAVMHFGTLCWAF